MPIIFPNSPVGGDTVIINSVEYTYDSTKTIWKTTDGAGTVLTLSLSNVSDTANIAFNTANAAFESSNTKVTTGKAIAMAIVFG